MAEEKVITCKKVENLEKNGKKWKRITAENGFSYNIFPSANGYGLIGDNSVGQMFKLVLETNERNPNFKDVVKVMFPDIPDLRATEKAKQITVAKDNKPFALSYAKDLAINNIISVKDIIYWSEYFSRYLDGDLNVGEADFASFIMRTMRSAVAEGNGEAEPEPKAEKKGKGKSTEQEELPF